MAKQATEKKLVNGLAVKTVKNTQYPVVDIDPTLIGVVDALRGRHFAPSEADVKRLAISLIHEGQEQAVRVRKDSEGKPVAVFGVTRILAGQMIRAGFTGSDGAFHTDPAFLIRAEVADIDADTAFLQAITENAHRNATSVVDDAFNQDELRTRGMNDAEIARLYGRDKAEVSRLKKLLTLSEEHLKMVHEKALSYSSAVELAFFKPEEREAVLEQTGGALSAIKEVRREQAPEAAADDDSVNVGKPETDATGADADTGSGSDVSKSKAERPRQSLQRTTKQIRNMVSQYCDHTSDQIVATLFSLMLSYIDGKKTDKEFAEVMDYIAPAKDRTIAEAKEAGWTDPAEIIGG